MTPILLTALMPVICGPRPNGEGQEMHGRGIQNQNTEARAVARLRQTLRWPLLEEMPLSWRECHP